MHRRDFLGIMGNGLAGLLLPGKSFSDEGAVAGNLYSLNLSKTLDPRISEEALKEAVTLYGHIGINFEEVMSVNSPPNLSGLDQCMVFYDSESQMRIPVDQRNAAEQGPDPIPFRRETKIDYDDQTIRSNCCSIYSNVITSKDSERLFVRIFSRLVAHELGHAFAQPHIYDNRRFDVKNSYVYLMAGRYLNGDMFHGINVKGGRLQKDMYGKTHVDVIGIPDFIRVVRNSGYDLTLANQIRESQFENFVYLDELTAQKSSLSYQR